MSSDEQLKRDVNDELHWNPRIDATHIRLSVSGGTVTVRGTVPTCAQKLAVEKAVRRVAGCGDAVVELGVCPSSTHTPDDADIAIALASALNHTEDMPHGAICASVERGCAVLTGEVDAEAQRHAAEMIASRTRGVVGVINQITVKRNAEAFEMRSFSR
jgi:osmotically-inducible protein OsmY